MKKFIALTKEIVSLINEWVPKLSGLTDEMISERRNIQNRSIKQILGHMIDSTSNNTHRIVHLQYQPNPLIFPNYATDGNNDRWIAIQDYQNEDWPNMIQLWKYSLLHFCHVIHHVEDKKLDNEWFAGPDTKISLKTMILDFNRHLKLHLSEIDELINSWKMSQSDGNAPIADRH